MAEPALDPFYPMVFSDTLRVKCNPRNHQGKSNVLLFHRVTEARRENQVRCRERLGGLLRYYHQDAA
jgi:hypothetical protein